VNHQSGGVFQLLLVRSNFSRSEQLRLSHREGNAEYCREVPFASRGHCWRDGLLSPGIVSPIFAMRTSREFDVHFHWPAFPIRLPPEEDTNSPYLGSVEVYIGFYLALPSKPDVSGPSGSLRPD
jgi:hypothetical protein